MFFKAEVLESLRNKLIWLDPFKALAQLALLELALHVSCV